jgi:integrase
VLKDVALDRLTGEYCAMVFERIGMFNEEIEAAREAERKPVLPGVKGHRTLRKRERVAAGEAWADSGRMFTDELGEALHPDYVSRRFREMAKAAGLPVIKFHTARHTAATLALEAGIDIKIVSEQLGHSTTRITQDLYQHVRHQVHADSAEKVVALLSGLKGAKATGI